MEYNIARLILRVVNLEQKCTSLEKFIASLPLSPYMLMCGVCQCSHNWDGKL